MSFLIEFRQEGRLTSEWRFFDENSAMTLGSLAASQGHVHMLKLLEDTKLHSSIQSSIYFPENYPLYYAVKFDHADAIQYIREKMDEIDADDWELGWNYVTRRCALKAVLQQEPNTLRYFVEGGNLDPTEDVTPYFDDLKYSMDNYYPYPSDWEDGSSLQRVHTLVWARLRDSGNGDVAKKQEIDSILNLADHA